MHPCELTDEQLLQQCETIRQRRSGPGGQHRNKVETAIRLEHRPSGVTAQASERRSQGENLQQALFRLRVNLALEWRSPAENVSIRPLSPVWQKRTQGGKVSINPAHADFPRLLAEVLDQLQTHHWEVPLAAEVLRISNSQVLKFLKLEPRAFQLFNEERLKLGLRPLS